MRQALGHFSCYRPQRLDVDNAQGLTRGAINDAVGFAMPFNRRFLRSCRTRRKATRTAHVRFVNHWAGRASQHTGGNADSDVLERCRRTNVRAIDDTNPCRRLSGRS